MTQIKVNQLSCKIGTLLLGAGPKYLRQAFHLEPEKISYEEMLKFLKDITSDQKVNYFSLADNFYYVIDWDIFKEILGWITELCKSIPYLEDVMDCDDAAYLVSVLISWIFHLNTCGVVHGQVNIGHFWNGIVAKKNGQLKLFYYDTRKKGYTEYEKGRPIIIGGWNYTPDSYRFF